MPGNERSSHAELVKTCDFWLLCTEIKNPPNFHGEIKAIKADVVSPIDTLWQTLRHLTAKVSHEDWAAYLHLRNVADEDEERNFVKRRVEPNTPPKKI
jgi:hypothetical protein